MSQKEPNRLVVACAHWATSLPSWLLDEIRNERWISVMKTLTRDIPAHEKVGDAEALAYLMTLSHKVAFSGSRARIFEYLSSVVLSRRNRAMPGVSPLEKFEELAEPEQQELKYLKSEIYRKRGDIVHPVLNILTSIHVQD